MHLRQYDHKIALSQNRKHIGSYDEVPIPNNFHQIFPLTGHEKGFHQQDKFFPGEV